MKKVILCTMTRNHLRFLIPIIETLCDSGQEVLLYTNFGEIINDTLSYKINEFSEKYEKFYVLNLTDEKKLIEYSIDANSMLANGDAISIKELAKVNSIEITIPVVLKGKKALEIYGSAKVSSKAIFKKFRGDLVFASSQKQTISMPSKLNSNVVFNGRKGSWNLDSDLNTKKDIILEQGFVNTNNKNIQAYSFLPKIFN